MPMHVRTGVLKCHTIKYGALKSEIWKNNTSRKVTLDVKFVRLYRNKGARSVHESQIFQLADLPKLVTLVQKTGRFIEKR